MALFRTLATVLKVKLGASCCAYMQETDKQFILPTLLHCQIPLLLSWEGM